MHGSTRHSGLDVIGRPDPPRTRHRPPVVPPLEAMEVLLKPGELLYIPPWWVCALPPLPAPASRYLCPWPPRALLLPSSPARPFPLPSMLLSLIVSASVSLFRLTF